MSLRSLLSGGALALALALPVAALATNINGRSIPDVVINDGVMGVPVGVSNPTSTLTLPITQTAYSAGSLIANSATAGSIVVPSFALPWGSALIPRLRLYTNDTTGWANVSIQVDLWSSAPTFVNGDRGAWSIATGTAAHLGAYSCTMSAEYGDGAYAECSPAVGTVSVPKLASGTSVYWTLQAVGASAATSQSKVFTLIAETLQ